MTDTVTTLYCHCAYFDVVPTDVKSAALRALAESGLPFEATPDLCELAAGGDPMMQRLAAAPRLRIAACHRRAVEALFAAADAPLRREDAEVVNMRTADAESAARALAGPNPAPAGAVEVASTPGRLHVVCYEGAGSEPLSGRQRFELVEALLEGGYSVTCTGSGGAMPAAAGGPVIVLARGPQAPDGEPAGLFADISAMDAPAALEAVESAREHAGVPKCGQWPPWFPVIDPDRCQNCRKCLNFCLFGTFDTSPDGRVRVANPASCKTYCPACARVCPSVALIFPKYPSGPICGEEPPAGDGSDEKVKVDLAELLAGDVREVLRRRGKQASVPADQGKPCRCQRARTGGTYSEDALKDLGVPAEAVDAIRKRLKDSQEDTDPPTGP